MAPPKKTAKTKYTPKKGVKKYTKKNYMKDPKSLTGPELKYVDVVSTIAPPIGSAFNITPAHLNVMTQASGPSNRVGLKARMKSLLIRANMVWPGGQTLTSPSQVRMVAVFDRQSNAALATRTDVFQDGTLFISPTNLANAERFTVLVDEVTEQIEANGQFNVAWQCYRKIDLESVWAPSGSIPTTGTILLFASCNSDSNSAVGTNLPTVEFYSRVRYTDI